MDQTPNIIATLMIMEMSLDNWGYVRKQFMDKGNLYRPKLVEAIKKFLVGLGRAMAYDDLMHMVAGEHTYVQETYGAYSGWAELNTVLQAIFDEPEVAK